MYILRPASAETETPLFLQLPADGLLFPERSTAKWIYESGIPEHGLIKWVAQNYGDPAKVFVDIGSHVGTYAIGAAHVFGHTYAFECNPKVFCYLAGNVALRDLTDKVTPIPCALGDRAGSLDYHIRSEDGGGNGIKKVYDKDADCPKVKVDVRTLDSFALSNIGCIKIDVEGFEKEVLMGARDTLKRSGYPPIVFESWGPWNETTETVRRELFEFIEIHLGYTITPLTGAQDMFVGTLSKS
jgi:FkbM family methyltransferase